MLNKILYILLLVIFTLIPSMKNLGDVYYSFSIFFIIFFVILFILLLKINIKLKVFLIITIIVIYKNTIYLVGGTFSTIFSKGYIENVNNRKDDSVFRKIVHNLFNNTFNLKFNFKKLPDKPSIFVCNYCSDRLENIACILIPKDMGILMLHTLKNISKLNKLIKWPVYTYKKDSYEKTKKEVIKHIKEGRSIFSYVSKTPRMGPTKIQNMRSGMFRLAKELNIPITLVAIDYIDINFGIIPYQNFNIVIGDTLYVDDVKDSVIIAKNFFKKMMIKFEKTKYLC